MDQSKPIVVGTDGTTRAERAVAKAAELAVARRTKLHIVTSFTQQLEDLVPGDVQGPARDRLLAEVEATSRGIERKVAAELADQGVDVEFHHERGNPVTVLHSTARLVDAGLIVVGNRGIDGPLGLVGRSIPQRVSRHAPCDVLVVDTAA